MTGKGRRRTILVVDDEPGICTALSRYLDREGYRAVTASSAEEGLRLFVSEKPEMAIVDFRLPGADGLWLLKKMRELRPRVEIVLITAYGGTDTAIRASLDGACAYLPKPFDLDEVGRLVRRTFDVAPVAVVPRPLAGESWSLVLHGDSAAVATLRELVSRAAAGDAPVLLVGEVGSGREWAARAIHQAAGGSEPFELLHCSSDADDPIARIESSSPGYFLLNEIGDLELDRALSLIQCGGASSAGRRLSASVRSSSGTGSCAGDGPLSDVCRRYGWSIVKLPSLAERRDDLPELVSALLERINAERDRLLRGLDRGALDLLQGRRFPGNLRELENCLRTAALATTEDVVRAAAFPADWTVSE